MKTDCETDGSFYSTTRAAFKYIHRHHLEEADWFLKADDDTYMIMENLRHLLKDHSPADPLYFGRRFKKTAKLEFMSGGAGYVLSKEALTRFAMVQIMCSLTIMQFLS